MTFPTIPTGGRVVTGVQADTTATRTFPNLSGLTKNSGDLLIAIVIAYQSSATANAVWSGWSAGWTEFVDQSTTTGMAIGAAYKWSTGSETGTISVTEAATITGHAVFILLSIPGAHPSTPPTAGSIANGTAAAANPAALDPAGWAAEDTLWVAVSGTGETATTGSYLGNGTTPPTNYSNAVATAISADVVGGCDGAVAFRQLNASSEDVGTWSSLDLSNTRNSALVIAVRPDPTQRINLGQVSETETAQPAAPQKIIKPGLVTETELVQPVTVDSGGPSLTRTDRLGALSNATGDFPGGTGAWTTAAFTPSDNSLLVVSAFAHGSNGGSTNTFATEGFTISDSVGLTWTERIVAYGDVAETPFDTVTKIWTAPVTTGVSMTLTFDGGGKDVGVYAVSAVDYTDYDTSSPVGATGANNQDTGFSNSDGFLTLSGAPASSSEVFAAVGIGKDTADATPGTGWTEIHDITNTSWGGIQSQIRSGSTSTSVDWPNLRPGGGNLFSYAAVAVEIKEAAGGGGQTINLGLVTEAETVQPATVRKLESAGLVTESETIQPSTGQKIIKPGLVVESETIQPATVQKLESTGLVAEAETIQAATVRKIAKPGQVIETELVQPVTTGGATIISVGLITEAETVQPATVRKQVRLGEAYSDPYSDHYLAPVEAELVQPITISETVKPGIVTESETVLAETISKIETLGLVAEAETVLAESIRKVVKPGLVVETEFVQPVSTGEVTNVPLGLIVEAETVRPATVRKTAAGGQQVEAETVQPVLVREFVRPGLVVETELAQPARPQRLAKPGQVAESETVRPVTIRELAALFQIVELETVRPVTVTGTARLIDVVITTGFDHYAITTGVDRYAVEVG